MCSINSDFIISYIDSFIECEKGLLWIVMEYMPGGDLLQLIQ